MNTPPLLLGAVLLFWGWQTGLIVPSVILGMVLESSRFIRFRLDLSSGDFKPIADVCTVILLGLFVYLFFTNKARSAILLFLQWLPLGLSPLVAAQVFSTTEKVEGEALFWILRRSQKKTEFTVREPSI